MDETNQVIVTEYVPPIAMSLVRVDQSNLRISPSVAGAIGAIVLHLLLAKSLGVALDAGKPPIAVTHPDQEKPLILLRPIARPAAKEVPLVAVSPITMLVNDNPTSLDPPAIEFERLILDDDAAEATANLTDPSLAKADEIYRAQTMARIERVWRRPRSTEHATANSFECRAQIEQDDHGNVKEVLLPVCEVSIAWKESLLSAIREASPLPAPPDPRAYRASLVLHFTGVAVSNDASEEFE
jgi:hypothetical protein